MRLVAVVCISFGFLAGCAKNQPVAEATKSSTEAATSSNEPIKTYPLIGSVTRLDAEHKIATIKHEQIGDWMGAMTMEFPVKDPADFAKLHEGQPVIATVNVQGSLNYWVSDVQELLLPTAPPPSK